jgi:hypothetical protein
MSRTTLSVCDSGSDLWYPPRVSILIIYSPDSSEAQKGHRSIEIRQATPTSCPALNNTIYHSVTGAAFKVTCNLDYPYNDLTSFYIGNMLECMDQCGLRNSENGTTVCVGVAWAPSLVSPDGSGNALCYLKHLMAIGENLWTWEVDTAKLQNSSSNSSTTTAAVRL